MKMVSEIAVQVKVLHILSDISVMKVISSAIHQDFHLPPPGHTLYFVVKEQ